MPNDANASVSGPICTIYHKYRNLYLNVQEYGVVAVLKDTSSGGLVGGIDQFF